MSDQQVTPLNADVRDLKGEEHCSEKSQTLPRLPLVLHGAWGVAGAEGRRACSSLLGAAHAPGLSQPLPTLPLGDAFAHLPGEAPAGCQLWGQLLGARAPGEVLQAEAAPPCARNPINRPQGQVTNSSIPRPGPTRKHGHFDLPLVLVTTFSLAIIRTRAGKCSSTHCAPRTPAQVWSQAAPEGPAG